MSLPKIYYSSALSLLLSSLVSRASKYHCWVVQSWYRVAEVCAHLPASCQWGIGHGVGSAVAQAPGNLASSPAPTIYHLCDLGQITWSHCPPSSPFMKWHLRIT